MNIRVQYNTEYKLWIVRRFGRIRAGYIPNRRYILPIFQPDSMYSTYSSTYLHASWYVSLRPRGDSMAKRGRNQQSSSILAKTLPTAAPSGLGNRGRRGPAYPFCGVTPKGWGDATFCIKVPKCTYAHVTRPHVINHHHHTNNVMFYSPRARKTERVIRACLTSQLWGRDTRVRVAG